MRRLAMAAMVMGAVVLWANASAAAPAAKVPEGAVMLDCGPKQPAVAFDHKPHAKVDCAKCHHTNKDLKAGAAQEVKKCSACHLTPEKPETLSCKEMAAKKNPFHVNCIDCHKAEKKGPTKCAECHVKK